jgi:CRP-like cAMP-binding protein
MNLGVETTARGAQCAPFAQLPASLREEALSHATERRYRQGEPIYRQGEDDGRAHFLLDGSVELWWQGRVTRTLTATPQGAEEPFDPPGRKRYTARAGQAATVLSLPRTALERVLEKHERERSDGVLEVSEHAGTTASDWMIRMLQSPLLAALPAARMQEIFERMQPCPVRADEVVIEQGASGDYYYVVAQGYCEVSRRIANGRGQIHLADLGPGATFGEEALISGRARNATVTMISDGLLMRLGREDFLRLIFERTVREIDVDAARTAAADGAQWLDVRYPEEHDARTILGSRNMPLHLLRLHGSRLPHDTRYIVCGDDREDAAIGAFLLLERGFDAVYLDRGVRAAIAHDPALDSLLEDAGVDVSVVYLPPGREGREAAASPTHQSDFAEHMEDPLDSTLGRIAGLYTHAEAQRAMTQPIPTESFADSSTANTLAEINATLSAAHDALAGSVDRLVADDAPTHAAWLTETEADELDEDLCATRDLGAALSIEETLAIVMRETERRVRAELERAIALRGHRLEQQYQAKLKRMRELTRQEIAQREASMRRSLARDYQHKEQVLRANYKKVMAFANALTRRQSQLREAREQFEAKLAKATQLYGELSRLAPLLDER